MFPNCRPSLATVPPPERASPGALTGGSDLTPTTFSMPKKRSLPSGRGGVSMFTSCASVVGGVSLGRVNVPPGVDSDACSLPSASPLYPHNLKRSQPTERSFQFKLLIELNIFPSLSFFLLLHRCVAVARIKLRACVLSSLYTLRGIAPQLRSSFCRRPDVFLYDS